MLLNEVEEEINDPVVDDEIDAGFDVTALPAWAQKVLAKLVFVLGKLLIKFGIKMAMPF